MNNVPLVCYTHTNAADVWPLYLRQVERFLPNYESIILCNEPYNFGPQHQCLQYDNADPHWKQVYQALEQLRADHFIWMQEDFLPLGAPDPHMMHVALLTLTQPEHSFVRLLRSGDEINDPVKQFHHVSERDDSAFAFQPTLWRKSAFMRILETARGTVIQDEPFKYLNAARELGITGLFWYDGEPKRGGAHYDSKLFPCICTAVVRGKWNLSEYRAELEPLLKEHRIDAEKRDVH